MKNLFLMLSVMVSLSFGSATMFVKLSEEGTKVSDGDGNLVSITYTIPQYCPVKLEAYDIKGKLVDVILNQDMDKGTYNVTWDSWEYGSGTYYFKLSAGENISIEKSVVIK